MGLKELRERRGLTQVRLSDVTGLAQSTISRIETGDKQPGDLSLNTAIRLGDALSVENLRELVK